MQSLQCNLFIAVFGFLSRDSTVSGFLIDLQLEDLNKGHTILGNDINLECTIKSNEKKIFMEWKAPINLNLTRDRINVTTITQKLTSLSYITRSRFSVKRSRKEDESIYYCHASSTENIYETKYKYIWVPVYDVEKHVIELHPSQTYFDVANTELQVHIRAHPEPKFDWIDKFNKTILANTTEKYSIATDYSNSFANYKTRLKFNNFTRRDFGNYSLIVKNEHDEKIFKFSVNVTGRPLVNLQTKQKEDSFEAKCEAISYPKSNITWEFKKCEHLACFLNESTMDEVSVSKFSEDNYGENDLEIESHITLNKSDVGVLTCNSENSFGGQSQMQYLYKTKSGFEVFEKNMIQINNSLFVETLYHETIKILCAVSLDFFPEIQWYRKDGNMSLDDVRVPIKGFHEYSKTTIDAVYSTVSILKVLDIGKTDKGEYFCRASGRNGTFVSKKFEIIAKEQPLLNVASNMQSNKTVLAKFGTSWKFYCNVDGYPTPSITWYKNNITLTNSNNTHLQDKNQTLALYDIGPSDNGTYKCEVTNRLQVKIIKEATLGAIENDFNWALVVIIVLAFVLAIISIFIALKIRKDNKLKNELKAMGLANFEEGAVENINPELTLGDQADLLPYDKKFEIPIENLILGKELGSGAFGVVYRGDLLDFPEKDTTTTVAVKTVNKFAGFECIKALASELKIMVHLGKHVNIVNLIGACTKDVTKKKLLVVVEFCPGGNLLDYILQNSRNFVDQRKNDGFDWTITPENSARKYTKLAFSESESNDSGIVDPETPDHKDYVAQIQKYICSQDLLVWAFQVSQGMEYLATNKVLHGDLAARNVLLGENNIVKISDFGLSRSMYKNGIYKKSANCPLPIKWMAVESIGENIFSTQSDVWSFGVLLWEFFSLAKNPYPGVPIDQIFYKKLLEGYRMESPQFATAQIYEVMLDCWDADPLKRPSFAQLGGTIGKMLEETVKNHYVDMTVCGYVSMKNQVSAENYLTKMASASLENQVSAVPHYLINLNYFHTYQNNVVFASDKTE